MKKIMLLVTGIMLATQVLFAQDAIGITIKSRWRFDATNYLGRSLTIETNTLKQKSAFISGRHTLRVYGRIKKNSFITYYYAKEDYESAIKYYLSEIQRLEKSVRTWADITNIVDAYVKHGPRQAYQTFKEELQSLLAKGALVGIPRLVIQAKLEKIQGCFRSIEYLEEFYEEYKTPQTIHIYQIAKKQQRSKFKYYNRGFDLHISAPLHIQPEESLVYNGIFPISVGIEKSLLPEMRFSKRYRSFARFYLVAALDHFNLSINPETVGADNFRFNEAALFTQKDLTAYIPSNVENIDLNINQVRLGLKFNLLVDQSRALDIGGGTIVKRISNFKFKNGREAYIDPNTALLLKKEFSDNIEDNGAFNDFYWSLGIGLGSTKFRLHAEYVGYITPLKSTTNIPLVAQNRGTLFSYDGMVSLGFKIGF